MIKRNPNKPRVDWDSVWKKFNPWAERHTRECVNLQCWEIHQMVKLQQLVEREVARGR